MVEPGVPPEGPYREYVPVAGVGNGASLVEHSFCGFFFPVPIGQLALHDDLWGVVTCGRDEMSDEDYLEYSTGGGGSCSYLYSSFNWFGIRVPTREQEEQATCDIVYMCAYD